jgi:hypothetical protein
MRENFYRDEPLCKHSGYEEAMADDFDIFVTAALEDNLSFIAVDKTNNEIAGVRITSIVRPDHHPEIPPLKSPKTGPIIDILVKLTEDAAIFELYPEIDHYADFFMVSVGRNYRGYGLATEIYERAFKMLSSLKFPLIKCVFSSPYTQKIARKRGFRELGKINFLDWKNEKGERYYPNANEDECAILMVKDLH